MTAEIRVLRPDDDRQGFVSGDEALDLYFHRYAGQNQFRHHVGVTYVAVEADVIVGFVTVSPVSMDAAGFPGGTSKPPYPLPALRIARLAVGANQRGRGLGKALLRFCFELAEKMRAELGCVGVIVDAKPDAVEYYRSYGFVETQVDEGSVADRPQPTMMFLPLGAVPRKR